MPEKTRHIFPSLDPKEEIPHEEILRGTGLRETRASVLRRMILELLPKIGQEALHNLSQDSQAMAVIEAVKREKANYKEVHESAWNAFLEDFIGYTSEIHLWKNPPEGTLWLANPQKNPFSRRAKELIEADDQETLLIGWHQYCGIIACEILTGNKALHEQNQGFPKPKSILQSRLYSQEEESDHPNALLEIWAWDKRNFEQQR